MYPELFTIPGTGITLYSFGLMVAIGVAVASWILSIELRRKQALGLIKGSKVRVTKVTQSAKGKTKIENLTPADRTTNIAIIAAFSGIVGAKFFFLLEHLEQFSADPIGMIFSGGGLTWYGGLVGGTIGVILYAKLTKISVPHLADAIAPALILGYGIGRIGCQLAGDGDWGIPSDPDAKPSWLPDFLWAETYPNRIYRGSEIPETGVYPTPLYETIMSFIICGILWFFRKHQHKAGWLFMMYVVWVGIERFLIEKIRINVTYDVFGFQLSQAEAISVVLIIAGSVGMYLLRGRGKEVQK